MSEAQPTWRTLQILARDLGLEISPDRLREAAKSHAALRPKLEAFRKLKLPYIDAIQPADVRSWIERGGRSAEENRRE